MQSCHGSVIAHQALANILLGFASVIVPDLVKVQLVIKVRLGAGEVVKAWPSLQMPPAFEHNHQDSVLFSNKKAPALLLQCLMPGSYPKAREL